MQYNHKPKQKERSEISDKKIYKTSARHKYLCTNIVSQISLQGRMPSCLGTWTTSTSQQQTWPSSKDPGPSWKSMSLGSVFLFVLSEISFWNSSWVVLAKQFNAMKGISWRKYKSSGWCRLLHWYDDQPWGDQSRLPPGEIFGPHQDQDGHLWTWLNPNQWWNWNKVDLVDEHEWILIEKNLLQMPNIPVFELKANEDLNRCEQEMRRVLILGIF